MTSQQLDEERIFHIARELHDQSTRVNYLDQICAGDQALRERVEALLEVHEQEKRFLKSEVSLPQTAASEDIRFSPGQEIGRYKLLQKIGEGGFGIVYMAEQHRPVRRKVALKIIKPGMDTQAVIARFEAERQALALMDHPNIARVLDGGATDSGRPYFVMELVKGVPLTEYCDKNELATERRLELFRNVCRAVQHAHQKGIIHRDLKPSNILVTLHDGQPVVKVIDFGVAKAINQQLTERTLFTAYGQMVGTPQYMSPEQAEMSGLDVDTRSDVYSLGVVLYELLTGTTPLEAERLRTAGYAELQRLIREEEPQKPSARLSTTGQELTIIAKHRNATPEKLSSLVQGDLDWIVMKSLEKDRSRRYSSPMHLLEDVENYLCDQPVDARPPTVGYRVSKYVRRHRVALLIASLLILSLTLGLVGTTWQASVAWRKTREAEEAIRSVRSEVLDRALEAAIRGDQSQLNELVSKAKELKIPDEWVSFLRGLEAFYRADLNVARGEFEQSIMTQSQNPAAVAMTVICAMWQMDLSVAENRLSELAQLKNRVEYDEYDATFRAFGNLYRSPQDAKKAFRSLLEERPFSATTRLFYAGSLAHVALLTGNEELPREALNEAIVVQRLTGDTPVVALFRLFCIAVAIGESDLTDAELNRLESVAEELRSKIDPKLDFPLWNAVQAMYLEEIGQIEAALVEWERAAEHGVYVDAFIARATGREDHASIRERIGKLTIFGEAYLGAEHSNHREAFIRRYGPDRFAALTNQEQEDAIIGMLILGDLDAARIASEFFIEQPAAGSYLTYPNPRDYLLDEESESDFLQRCGGTRLELEEAHLVIALKHLAMGDRQKAIDAIEQCIRQRQINNQTHYVAKSIRDRLLEDPNWPAWIRG